MSKYAMIIVTTPKMEEAKYIAEKLIKKSSVACVNIIPKVHSIYKWKGEVEHSKEAMMIIKTDNSKVKELKKQIKKLHSYDVPEIIVLKIDDGDKEYLNWINSVVK